jgi:cytochrome P450
VPHSTFRYAVEPIEISGVTIPAGAQVIINLASANRDEDRYVEPETLDIDRKTCGTSVSATDPLLPRRPAGPHGGPDRPRFTDPAVP